MAGILDMLVIGNKNFHYLGRYRALKTLYKGYNIGGAIGRIYKNISNITFKKYSFIMFRTNFGWNVGKSGKKRANQ